MANVNIAAMPPEIREIPERWRPLHPPIFDDAPSAEDIELARALLVALDPASQAWYARCAMFRQLAPSAVNQFTVEPDL